MSKIYALRFATGDPRTYTGLAPTFLSFTNLTNGSAVTPPALSEAAAGTGFYQFTYGTTQPIAFLVDAATTLPGAIGRYVTGQIDPADRTDEYAATMIAIGTSLTAQGVSLFAFGTSFAAQGISLYALGFSTIAFGVTLTAIGTTHVAQGTTAIALGTTAIASLGFQGTTLIGFGTSLAAMGLSLGGVGLAIGSTASPFGSSSQDPVDLYGFLKRAQEFNEGNETYTKATSALTFSSRAGATLLASKSITDTATSTTKT